jgi:transcriptional regulator with XRE-family HTH domain
VSAPPAPNGNNLRRFREEANLSQEALARRADLSMMTVNRVERGRIPSLATARKIARALGRTVDEIWPDLAAA